MLFYPEEKVFSLSRTANDVPYNDISSLFSQFYCYLLVAGLYREGEGDTGARFSVSTISDPNFYIPEGSYLNGINSLLAKGLRDRYMALVNHYDLTDPERDLLTSFDGIFTNDPNWYVSLRGSAILAVAYSRDFSDDMRMIARYVAVAYGQSSPMVKAVVPRLYLSVFGNIHLAKHDVNQESGPRDNLVILDAPAMVYGMRAPSGERVTALWAMLSAMTDTFLDNQNADAPGDRLGDVLASLTFLTDRTNHDETISIPRYAQMLYSKRIMGLDDYVPVSAVASFYNDFLYGSTGRLTVSRSTLLKTLLNLMMEKMGETQSDYLFGSNSFYKNLTTPILKGSDSKPPAILRFALETLDASDTNEDKDDTDTDSTPSDQPQQDTDEDPQTDDGGYDPSSPPPEDPIATPIMDKDTIDLVSFDKSGEGVNEDLYRQAVVALNDRLRDDTTLAISTETKDALDYWVNGFLYRTAIMATKDQIAYLKLESYVKTISTKG